MPGSEYAPTKIRGACSGTGVTGSAGSLRGSPGRDPERRGPPVTSFEAANATTFGEAAAKVTDDPACGVGPGGRLVGHREGVNAIR
jgi:hypothetical protein